MAKLPFLSGSPFSPPPPPKKNPKQITAHEQIVSASVNRKQEEALFSPDAVPR